MNLQPQDGPQTKFLATEADIAFYGGAAGGGKTYGLLLEALRNIHTDNFKAVIFRRTSVEIRNPGGLWDESSLMYQMTGGAPLESRLEWSWPKGMDLKFAHMEHESDKFNWQGSQIGYVGFDEVPHFSRTQFFYMLGRLRSSTGVPGYVRATCNPDAESWVAKLLEWWIDQETGFPIPERDGVLRWMLRQGDDIVWSESKDDLIDQYGKDGEDALSVTFIRARVDDNKILLEKNPRYLANLKALDRVERARLLDGNWKIKAASGEYFRKSDFEIIDEMPNEMEIVKRIRYWDRAGSEPTPSKPNPDWTSGTRMCVTRDGVFIIEDVERFRKKALGVESAIKNTAGQDKCAIGLEQDPGQAGKMEAEYLSRKLAGFDVKVFTVHKDKVTRAQPYSSQVQAGNVKLLRGEWNEAFLIEHENFPPKSSGKDQEGAGKDDQVDSSSGAFNFLTGDKVGTWVASSDQGNNTIAPGLAAGTSEW